MKLQNLILSILLCICLLCGCKPANNAALGENTVPPPSNLYVGMSIREFDLLYGDFPSMCGYYFVCDDHGNPAVATGGYDINGKDIITSVATCTGTIDNKWFLMAADTNHDGAVDGFDVIETDLQSLDMHNIEQKNTVAYLSKDETEDETEAA